MIYWQTTDKAGNTISGAYGTIKLDGKQRMANTTSSGWNISDPTGTGAGWTAYISATDFISGSNALTASNMSIEFVNNDISTIAGNAKPALSVTIRTKYDNAPNSMLSALVENGIEVIN